MCQALTEVVSIRIQTSMFARMKRGLVFLLSAAVHSWLWQVTVTELCSESAASPHPMQGCSLLFCAGSSLWDLTGWKQKYFLSPRLCIELSRVEKLGLPLM